VKKKLYSILPEALKLRIKKAYYWKKFQTASATDEVDLRLIGKIVKPGDHVIDVGANFGSFSKEIALRIGDSGKLLSLEPVPETYQVLKNNLTKAGLNQVIPLCLAASDKEGPETLNVPNYADGSANFYSASLQETPNAEKISINCQTLDNLCTEYKLSPAFIKIDVEGHEPAVLAGAKATITNHFPILLIEVNDGFYAGSTGAAIQNFLFPLGYTMHAFTGSVVLPVSDKEDHVNFIFLPKNVQIA